LAWSDKLAVFEATARCNESDIGVDLQPHLLTQWQQYAEHIPVKTPLRLHDQNFR
jgi:hypothetical protein